MAEAVVQRITVYPLLIPLRHKVSHAAAQRGVSDPIVVSIELTNGVTGFGETIPRRYVTDESVESVVGAIHDIFAPALMSFHPESLPAALEAIEALPWYDASERLIPAARAGVELAMLDAALRSFHRSLNDVVQWMGLPGFGTPGSLQKIRYSGVLAANDSKATLRQLRRLYWYGLRDFKLKVGVRGDRERLERVVAYLARPISREKATLRVDANGAWLPVDAIAWLADAARFPIAAIEQPLAKGSEDSLPALRDALERDQAPTPGGGGAFPSLPLPLLMHDESLVTIEDARRLIDLGVADAFNIRISKCGGLLPSLRIAALAKRHQVRIQLGCMVGETSILSAAGLRFLEVCPGVTWAEGCFGPFLLRGDVTEKSLRFGYGGRPPRLRDPGLLPFAATRQLMTFGSDAPAVIHL